MNDPAPENISGEIVERHTYSHEIHHRIPWGYVTLGVGMAALAYVLHRRFVASGETGSESEESTEDGEEWVDVPVEDLEERHNQVAGLVTER